MTLDNFSSAEIKLLNQLVVDEINNTKAYIKEIKATIAYKQIYAEDIEKGDIEVISNITDVNTGVTEESSPEDLLEMAEGWLKEYQNLQAKIEPYIKLIDSVK